MIIPPIDPAVLIRDVNASNEEVENQCLRARRAADVATRSGCAADRGTIAARAAEVAYETIQAEHPRRRASLPRQVMFAFYTIALDGVACYFAAQALDGNQDATLVWTGLFLAVLAGGEVALDFYRDRNKRAWRALVLVIGFFVVLLGTLRFWFLYTVGVGGLVPTLAGALLFTGATAGFLAVGYRALRIAETPSAWQARRKARRERQVAQALHEAAHRDAAERDRLIDAYLGHVRRQVLRTCALEEQLATESAVREHLSGRRALNERPPSSGARPARRHPRRHRVVHFGVRPASAAPHAHAHASRPAPDLGTRYHHRPRFPVGAAGYGSARSGLGPARGDDHHPEPCRRSDAGYLTGSGPCRHGGARTAGAAPPALDHLPATPARPGGAAVPEHDAARPGSTS
jgi:hypothetical protein